MNIDSDPAPICDLGSGLLLPEAAWFVVFGATGDLAKRKIFPALFELHAQGKLPRDLVMLGFARRPLPDEEFRRSVAEGLERQARRRPLDGAALASFLSRIFYLPADLEEAEGYARLARILGGVAAPGAGPTGLGPGAAAPRNALFYLAVGPEHFGPIAERLGAAGLGTAGPELAAGAPAGDGTGGAAGWRRLVVEKPYGSDGASARRLTEVLQRNFREKDIFRIDHYLGKETVQNLLYLRFANSIFEPLWNRNHIESIDISVFETEGIGGRGGYYDKAGAARDMLQNHLLQLLCMTTMEPPASLDPESLRDEKVKVLRSISGLEPGRLLANSRRGQYVGGSSPEGRTIPAYAEEGRVAPGSRTETYVLLRLELDNWRFSGVPMTLRTGKAFAEKYSEIVIRFRRPPAALFAAQCGPALASNTLTVRIQPDEGVWLGFNSKVPGRPAIRPNDLRFSYRDSFDYLPEAYERLIADVLAGDSTLFIRADESEGAWRIVDALEAVWAEADPASAPERGGLFKYSAGSPVPEIGL